MSTIGWKSVFQNIDPSLLRRQDALGGALSSIQGALNTYQGEVKDRNTQQALLALNQANNISELQTMQPEFSSYLDGSRGAVNAPAILDALNTRKGVLQKEWDSFEQGQVSNQLNQMAINGTTSMDAIKALGVNAPDSALGLLASAARNQTQVLADAEDKAYRRATDALKLDMDVSRLDLEQQRYLSSEAEKAYRMPSAESYETAYDSNGNAYVSNVVKPGYGDIRGNIALPLTSTASAKRAAPFMPAITGSADKWGVNQDLLTKLIETESNFNISAKSGAGAKGIAQIMGATAKDPGYNVRALPAGASPERQIEFSAEYLSALNKHFKDPVIAVAAYNAGPGKLESILKGGKIPKETSDYVQKILGTDLAGHVSRVRAGGLGKQEANSNNGITFSVSNSAMDGARSRLNSVVAKAEADNIVKKGTEDYSKAEYELNEYIREGKFTGNTAIRANARVFAMIKNQPYYDRADPVTKKSILQDAVNYDRENTGFFSRNSDFNKLNEHLRINANARKSSQVKAYDQKVLSTFHAEGQKLLAEAARKDPRVTLDMVLKAMNPDLYAKWDDTRKKSAKYE